MVLADGSVSSGVEAVDGFEALTGPAQAPKARVIRIRKRGIFSLWRTILRPRATLLSSHRLISMELFDWMARGGHDRLLAVQDSVSGLRAWIALHEVSRGPAYGGIRVWHYRTESEAALDALRLSKAMTIKCVLAGVRGGGAKTVVLANQLKDRTAAVEVLGREIEALGGVYRTGPDAGFTLADQEALARTTRWGVCDAPELRPSGEATAEGALWGLKAGLSALGENNLSGIRVAIQGLGAVGLVLARRLQESGANVVAADLSPEACEKGVALGVDLVDPGDILAQECDVLAPCALGGVLHDLSIPRLRTRMVAPCANNTLASSNNAAQLDALGILYLPDFVLNAGALIEGAGHDASGKSDWDKELRGIGDTVTEVIRRARADSCSTLKAARHLASEMLAEEKSLEVAVEVSEPVGA